MKKMLLIFGLFIASLSLMSQELKLIRLNPPDTAAGLPVMQAFAHRSSQTDFDAAPLSLTDLSNLLWAANGINRPETGKRTAPSAMNAQDIDLYAVFPEGVFLYDAAKHQLDPVATGDHRALVAGRQANFATAPVMLLLVSDISRFPVGDEALKLVWAAEDAGFVSQNIGLFCAGMGLATRPRASMDTGKLKEVLNLRETQHLMLNNPVSYLKK